jgi:hypothetical protein
MSTHRNFAVIRASKGGIEFLQAAMATAVHQHNSDSTSEERTTPS